MQDAHTDPVSGAWQVRRYTSSELRWSGWCNGLWERRAGAGVTQLCSVMSSFPKRGPAGIQPCVWSHQ